MKKTMVQFTHELTETLRSLGHKGETYEDVVWRLISNYKKKRKELEHEAVKRKN